MRATLQFQVGRYRLRILRIVKPAVLSVMVLAFAPTR
jgi:hypothetical protein